MSKSYGSIAWLFFAIGLSGGSWSARIASLPNALHLSNKDLGLVLLTSALGAVMAFWASDWLLRHVAQAKLTACSVVGMCAAWPVAGLSTDVWTVAGALFSAGVCSGLINVSMNLYAVRRETRDDVQMLASCHGWCSAGALTGAIGGQLAAHFCTSLGLHLSLVSAIILALSSALVPHLWRLDALHRSDAPSQTPTRRTRRGKTAPLSLVLPGVMVACAAVCEGTFHTWSAVYLHQDMGMSEADAAFGFVIFTLSMVMSRLVVERIAKRFGAQRVVAAGSMTAMAGVTLMLGAPGGLVALAGIAVTGLGLACTVPLAYREASRRRPQAVQKALATMAQCTYVGALAAPPGIGFVAHHFGLRLALGATTLMLAVVAALCGTLAPSTVSSRSPAPAG